MPANIVIEIYSLLCGLSRVCQQGLSPLLTFPKGTITLRDRMKIKDYSTGILKPLKIPKMQEKFLNVSKILKK